MNLTLSDLGWSRHFEARDDSDGVSGSPGRVSEVHRDAITALTPDGEVALTVPVGHSTGGIAVGDWVRFDAEQGVVVKVCERRTELQRRTAGTSGGTQLIAANVDTLFIVTSCNDDFNLARLERYLALAASGGIMPVILLTKADLNVEADTLRRQAERLSPLAVAISVNALDPASLVDQFSSWLRAGETGALVGSSGVGKSTILNTLTGAGAATRGIREDDAKGRHTTTARSLHRTRSGGWLIDTPGIRQLALVGGADAIDEVFQDVTDLIGQCRFTDCAHETEPGCAICAAIEAGTLDADRVRRWRKLRQEDAHASETVHEARSRQKRFSKHVRSAIDGGQRGPKR